MPRTPSPRLWSTYTLAGHRFQLLNLDHPEVAARVLGDLDAGIAVYYDSRWDLTTQFCRFLLAHPALVAGRSVLVLGAGKNSIRISPPLVLTRAQAETAVKIIDESLSQL